MRKKFILLFSGIMMLLATGDVFAQRGRAQAETLEVKIGSPLPRESPWGRTLDRIASEWNRITNGQVRLNVRHGGIEGNEGRMHQSLASNNIQAAIFTPFGLNEIDPIMMTLSVPFLIRNEIELNAVMREVQGELETKLNSGNYFMLAWSKSGFVNFFSRDPVFSPDDLKKQRVASNPESAELNTTFKTMGFQVFEADWAEVGNRLNAGTVTAIYNQPAAVAAYQLHAMVKNMLNVNIAPVVGGIVMNQITWRRIGELNPGYQQELLSATRRIAEEFDRTIQKTVSDAVQSMSRAGLKVNQPSPAQEQLWYSEVEKAIPSLLGHVYNRDMYNRICNILAKHRTGQ